MKLFPAKCMSGQHCVSYDVKRETVHCWPLLHVMAGISARFSNFAFVLFCYITNHLMTGPLGSSEICFPRISMFPSTSSRETLRFSGNKIYCSPRDQSLSVYYHYHCHCYCCKLYIVVVVVVVVIIIIIIKATKKRKATDQKRRSRRKGDHML